ncbi:MAG: zinc ribbon domain-containing protein [Peptococcaceae bacterium]|nr:zinc ribbon domain-containing protein [Peptococcaceae bacterium]
MPIYEFKCQSCGRRFEKLCSLGETGETLPCPQCGTTGPRRVMSGFAAKSSGQDGFSGSGGSGCGGCTSTNCGSCGH